MLRFYSAQDGHHVQLIPPKDITGGVTSPAFAVKQYRHVTIRVDVGVSAAAFTKIIVNQCTAQDGTGATAIPFTLFKQETSNGDVLSGATAVTSAGYTPSANDDIFYVIEIPVEQLTQGYDYLQLELTNGTNSVIASAVAILSAARYEMDQSPTVLA